MARTETINRALELSPVPWGFEDDNNAYPLRYEPTRHWKTPWTTKRPDGTGLANIDAQGKVVEAWMLALVGGGANLEFSNHWGDGAELRPYGTFHGHSDTTDWLLTLAEAIVEVMGDNQ